MNKYLEYLLKTQPDESLEAVSWKATKGWSSAKQKLDFNVK